MNLTSLLASFLLSSVAVASPTTRFSLLAINYQSNIHFTSPGIHSDSNELVIAAGASPFIGNYIAETNTISFEQRLKKSDNATLAAAPTPTLYLSIADDYKVVVSENPHTWSIIDFPELQSDQQPKSHQVFPELLAYSANGGYIAVERKNGGYNVYTTEYKPPHDVKVVPLNLTISWMNVTAARIGLK